MKNSNLFGVFITSIALLTVSSGCHRKPTSLTPIPGVPSPQGQENGNPANAMPIAPETPVTPTPEGIPISANGRGNDIVNGPHNEDREKFKEDTIHFGFDKATVRPEDESKLQDIATYLKGDPSPALIIEGNCDERGTEKYNLSLGERRALAAREYLANLGIDAQRIVTRTYGFSRPVDPGHNEAAWKQNRRDDFVLATPK